MFISATLLFGGDVVGLLDYPLVPPSGDEAPLGLVIIGIHSLTR